MDKIFHSYLVEHSSNTQVHKTVDKVKMEVVRLFFVATEESAAVVGQCGTQKQQSNSS